MSKYNEFSDRTSSRDDEYKNHCRRRKQLRQKRKENKILLLLAAVVVVVVVILLSVLLSGDNKNNVLVGTWKYDQYTEYEFFKDGTGCLCVDNIHYEYKYKISGDKLKLDFTEDVVRDCEYKFVVKNKNLTLVGGKGTDNGTYKLTNK